MVEDRPSGGEDRQARVEPRIVLTLIVACLCFLVLLLGTTKWALDAREEIKRLRTNYEFVSSDYPKVYAENKALLEKMKHCNTITQTTTGACSGIISGAGNNVTVDCK